MLTPEQEALKAAAMQFKVHGMFTTSHGRFNELANVDAILDLLAQLEGCNEDYGCAVDSVAQLQEEVFEVRAQLEAVQEAPTEKPDWWKEMLAAVMRELPRNMGRWKDGNAPGHCHDVPGIWDSDNGAKAGTTCAWCLVWNKAKNELDAAASVPAQTGAVDYGASINAPYLAQPVQAVPRVLFDGMAVYEEVRRKAGHMRTSPENVSDVLDAAVRLIRAAKAAPGEPGQ